MYSRTSSSRGSRGLSSGRIIIAIIVAAVSLLSYFGSKVYNPITDEEQYINITTEQEIAMGLQAAPEMAQEFGGLDPSQEVQAYIDEIGNRLVQNSDARESDYPFEFSLLADEQTINAFALPGGPVFITAALYDRLETEGQVAGVLAHEMGHVVARHSAEHIAKAQLTQGLTGAAVIASYDPDDPNSQRTAQMAILIGQLINLKFSREDELEADRLGVRFMADAGYDPRSLIRVMEILAEASSGGGPPEFFSTHPNPENRVANIQEAIEAEFPNGVPDGLIQ